MKKFVLVCAVMLALSFSKADAAVLVNPGFETGDFYGWTANEIGPYSVVVEDTTSHGMIYDPVEGDYMAELVAGAANAYNTISQNIYLDAGSKLSGYAAFLGFDYDEYNDDAYVKIFQAQGLVVTPWASSISSVGNFGDSGWQYWEWTAPTSGNYVLSYGVKNTKDNLNSSVALFDTASPAPEPSSIALCLIGLAGALGLRKRNREIIV